MKIAACWLGLVSLPIVAATEKLPKALVGVYIEYQHPVGEPLTTAFENEVGRILSPLGFDVRWGEADSPRGEVWADLAMVNFRGTCDLDAESHGDFREGTLGWTQVSGGVVQSYIEIDCNRIGALMRTQISRHRPGDSQQMFARAIARVLAHELYHVLARTGGHDSSGVGKPVFTAGDLLAERFQFDPDQARTLRSISREDAGRFAREWK